jgi:hypothetical protein
MPGPAPEPRTKTDQDIFKYIDSFLSLLAGGYVQFTPDAELRCYQPIGPAPTDKEKALIDNPIRSARPLYRSAVLSLLRHEQSRSAE